MRRSQGSLTALLILWLTLTLGGCSGEAKQSSDPETTSPPDDQSMLVVTAEGLPGVGTHLGATLDGGRIRVAPPVNWDVGSRKAAYVALFREFRDSPFPRILISADEDNYAGIDHVDSENVEQFVAAIQAEIADEKGIERPARSAQIGPHFGAYYSKLGRVGKVAVDNTRFVTVHAGRKYTVEISAHRGKSKPIIPIGHSVAAALDFVEPPNAKPADDENENPAADETEEPAADET